MNGVTISASDALAMLAVLCLAAAEALRRCKVSPFPSDESRGKKACSSTPGAIGHGSIPVDRHGKGRGKGEAFR